MRKFDFYFMLLVAALVGALELVRGQAVDFDLMLYHFYNPFQLLYNRFDVDFDVAHLQTYLNPIMDLPYFLFNYEWNFDPVVFAFFHASVQSLTVFFEFKILQKLIEVSDPEEKGRLGIQLLIALLACLCTSTPLFVELVGTQYHDTTVSLFFVCSLYLLLSFENRSGRIFAAGFFVGLACGLKLTFLVYLVALLVVIPFLFGRRIRLYGQIAAGIALGLVA